MVHLQDAQSQRQLRPRRVDGGTPRHLPSAPVHSAGSQLPLEGTERYQMAQMVKSRFCNASCATEHSEMALANAILVYTPRPAAAAAARVT